jgi:hypothetical protein
VTEPSHNHAIGALETEVRNLKEGLGRIEQRMDSGFADIKEALTERLNKHSDRLGGLERWRSSIAGARAVIVALWSSIVAVLVAAIALLKDWVNAK